MKRNCKKYHRWLYMNSWDSYTHFKYLSKHNGKIMMELAICYDCEDVFIIKKMPILCGSNGVKHRWRKMVGEKNKKYCVDCMEVK